MDERVIQVVIDEERGGAVMAVDLTRDEAREVAACLLAMADGRTHAGRPLLLVLTTLPQGSLIIRPAA